MFILIAWYEWNPDFLLYAGICIGDICICLHIFANDLAYQVICCGKKKKRKETDLP
jgi:hypothetical protein